MGIIEATGITETGTFIEAEKRITTGGEIKTWKMEMTIGDPEIAEISNYPYI